VNVEKSVLAGRVNELLGEIDSPVEFGDYRSGSAVVPVISLSTCERPEKERIIRLGAYTLTIDYNLFPAGNAGKRRIRLYLRRRRGPGFGGRSDSGRRGRQGGTIAVPKEPNSLLYLWIFAPSITQKPRLSSMLSEFAG
jgi:hypothetical protein